MVNTQYFNHVACKIQRSFEILNLNASRGVEQKYELQTVRMVQVNGAPSHIWEVAFSVAVARARHWTQLTHKIGLEFFSCFIQWRNNHFCLIC